MIPTLDQIQKVTPLVHRIAHDTPCEHSTTFSTLTGQSVYLKLENLQKTGSFKIRGAYAKIMSLTDTEREKGVIAASAGNHAQGVALASQYAGMNSTIVMPEGASLAKIEATKRYGANVVLHGASFDEAMAHAQHLHHETGAALVHAFDDPQIIAGQGTIGLEILTALPEVDAIVCPIGGGGLISGVAIAAKELKPSIKIYGVEAANCASMSISLQEKCPTDFSSKQGSGMSTIADGIAVKKPGALTYDIVQKYVDDIFVVDDIEISTTMLYLLERSKLLVEGSGAAALAALLYHKPQLSDQTVATIISGGNIDINFVSRVIERGLVEAGRFLTLSTTVPDKPGFLNRLLHIIAELEANVISIHHHRIGSQIMPGQTEIELSLETKDAQHIEAIEKRLQQEGYEFSRKV